MVADLILLLVSDMSTDLESEKMFILSCGKKLFSSGRMWMRSASDIAIASA